MRPHHRDSWSHIDYFLISPSLAPKCMACDIIQNATSDHSMVTIDIDVSVSKRGLGIWKLNEELLGDREFCDFLERYIKNICTKYEYLNPIEQWELIKSEAR